MIITLLILLLIAAGISEAISDTLAFRFNSSIFNSAAFKNEFWNPELSYTNKGNNIFKRTILVFITDAWHLFKALHTFFLFSMVITVFALTNSICMFTLYLVVAYMLKKVIFELFWGKILIKK